jgi:hypothetical protein
MIILIMFEEEIVKLVLVRNKFSNEIQLVALCPNSLSLQFKI